MKRLSMVLAVMAALALGVTAANAAKGTKPVQGTISKIDGANITVTPRAAKGAAATDAPAAVTFATDDKTTVTIKGETKTVADLTVGLRVRVTLDAEGKTATAITSGRAAAPAASAPATTNP